MFFGKKPLKEMTEAEKNYIEIQKRRLHPEVFEKNSVEPIEYGEYPDNVIYKLCSLLNRLDERIATLEKKGGKNKNSHTSSV
jgi:hypothetical protein